jgi:hypothetical protein
MKAKRLPQEDIVLEVIENLHEVIWSKISSGVKNFIKMFIEDLLIGDQQPHWRRRGESGSYDGS